MCDFEKRVDVFEVNLPESEDLDLRWVQRGEIDICSAWAKEKMVVPTIQLIPCLLDHGFAHIIVREIAIITVFAIVIVIVLLGIS